MPPLSIDPWLVLGPEHRPYTARESSFAVETADLSLPSDYLPTLERFGQGLFNGSRWLLPPAHLQTIGSRLGCVPSDSASRQRLEGLWIVAQDDAGNFWALDADTGSLLRIDRSVDHDEDVPTEGFRTFEGLLAGWAQAAPTPYFVRAPRYQRLAADYGMLTPHFDLATLSKSLATALAHDGWRPLGERVASDGMWLHCVHPEAHLLLTVDAIEPARTLAPTNGRLRLQWLGPEAIANVALLVNTLARQGWLFDPEGPRTVHWDDARQLPAHLRRALQLPKIDVG